MFALFNGTCESSTGNKVLVLEAVQPVLFICEFNIRIAIHRITKTYTGGFLQ